MKKLFLLFFCLFLAKITFAQIPQTELKRTVFEPPKTVNGFKVRWATLSKGRYQEVFTNDTIQQIGCIYFNRITGEVVSEVVKDSLYFPADVSSRWWSVDPLASKYPELCPYVYVGNNPIIFIDPDGRDIFPAGLNGTSYQKIFEGMQGNSIYQKYSKGFNRKGQDLYFRFDIPPFNQKFGGGVKDNLFGKTVNESSDFSNIGTYFIPKSDVTEEQRGNMLKKSSISDMHRAVVFIHEVIHAYIMASPTMRSKFIIPEKNDKSMERNVNDYNFSGDHEYIANNFIGDIEQSLGEFAQQNKITNLTDMDFKALSWVGLRETKAFTSMWAVMSEKDQKAMKDAYRKLQYSSFVITNTETKKVEQETKGEGNIPTNSN